MILCMHVVYAAQCAGAHALCTVAQQQQAEATQLALSLVVRSMPVLLGPVVTLRLFVNMCNQNVGLSDFGGKLHSCSRLHCCTFLNFCTSPPVSFEGVTYLRQVSLCNSLHT